MIDAKNAARRRRAAMAVTGNRVTLTARAGDWLAVFIDHRHAVLEQNLVDVRLAFADDVVERPFPQVVALAHAHGDAEIETAGLVHVLRQRHDGELVATARRVVTGDRAPHHAGLDLT